MIRYASISKISFLIKLYCVLRNLNEPNLS